MKFLHRKSSDLFVTVLAVLALGTGLLSAQSLANATTPPPSKSASTTATSDPKELTPVATDKTSPKSPWEFDIGIPAWASGINGTVGVNGVTGHVHQSFTSLWDHLDSVVPLSMDLRYQKWGFHIDGQYMKLSTNFATRGIIYNSATLTQETAFANFNVNYRFLDSERWKVDASLGGRYTYMSLSGNLTSRFPAIIPNKNETGSAQWIDPIIGTDAKVHIYKPFSLMAWGDVGGFGVDSELTYQLYGGAEAQIARHFYMDVGYRYWKDDYSYGGATFDVAFKGPEITFGANF
jgi:opacity protein-like surface antigen